MKAHRQIAAALAPRHELTERAASHMALPRSTSQ